MPLPTIIPHPTQREGEKKEKKKAEKEKLIRSRSRPNLCPKISNNLVHDSEHSVLCYTRL